MNLSCYSDSYWLRFTCWLTEIWTQFCPYLLMCMLSPHICVYVCACMFVTCACRLCVLCLCSCRVLSNLSRMYSCPIALPASLYGYILRIRPYLYVASKYFPVSSRERFLWIVERTWPHSGFNSGKFSSLSQTVGCRSELKIQSQQYNLITCLEDLIWLNFHKNSFIYFLIILW